MGLTSRDGAPKPEGVGRVGVQCGRLGSHSSPGSCCPACDIFFYHSDHRMKRSDARSLRGDDLAGLACKKKGPAPRSWPRQEAWGRRGDPRAVATARGQAVTAPLPPSPATARQLGPRSHVAAGTPGPQVSLAVLFPEGCKAVSARGQGRALFSYPSNLPSSVFCKQVKTN